MSTTYDYPLYPVAIILPALALPAVILDIPPLVWHITQRNIAASSLILWVIILNSFLFINPLIWPRDNILEWWSGEGLCDVQVRITVGAVVALPCAVVCIMRKLAKIMDTRHITVVSGQNRKVRENVVEILWCWGFPVFMMLVYYIVQPIRYFIFSISGCIPAYDASWPSIVLSWMWQPIIVVVATYYAGLLLYRLYRYRREFTRLIAARDTTKSRFIRLLIMSLLTVFVTLPYSWWFFYKEVKSIRGPFDWSTVHGPRFNEVIKVPTYGQAYIDSWGRVVVGYLIFFVFGTGHDAKTLYKKMLLACGLGRVWPSLRAGDDTSRSRTQSSSSRSWFWLGSKTKTFFTLTWTSVTSRTTTAQDPTRSGSNQPISSIDSVLEPHTPATEQTSGPKPSFLRRLFSKRPATQPTVLPLYSPPAKKSIDESELSPRSTYSAGPSSVHPHTHTHAWVAGGRDVGSPTPLRHGDNRGVTVMKEVKQERKNVNDEKNGDMV